MSNEARKRYDTEVALGKKAENAYSIFIEGFLKKKREELYDSFCNASMEKPEVILEAKRLALALNIIEEEIKTLINTGNLAAKSLALLDEKPTEG